MSESEIHDEPNPAVAGSILLVALPELDAVIEPWRSDSAPDGIDAHMTVLSPFLPEPQIDEEVLAELRSIFRSHQAFDVTFARTGTFPEFLYLAPEPGAPVSALTDSVFERWPEYPPYEGKYEDRTPHLSVVYDRDDEFCEAARIVLEPRLPIHTRVTAVDLLCFDGRRWNLRERFPLG
jgi:2'-5' RNA ligase